MITTTLRQATQEDVDQFMIVQDLVGIQYAGILKALTEKGVILAVQQVQDQDGWEMSTGTMPISGAQIVEIGERAYQTMLLDEAGRDEDRL
jgi:hypothetical protein